MLLEMFTTVDMGVGKRGGAGGHVPPLDFHTISLEPPKFQKFLRF